jgi:hypothetical protein
LPKALERLAWDKLFNNEGRFPVPVAAIKGYGDVGMGREPERNLVGAAEGVAGAWVVGALFELAAHDDERPPVDGGEVEAGRVVPSEFFEDPIPSGAPLKLEKAVPQLRDPSREAAPDGRGADSFAESPLGNDERVSYGPPGPSISKRPLKPAAIENPKPSIPRCLGKPKREVAFSFGGEVADSAERSC